MPLPVNRESIDTTLEDRYTTQKVGGAYDAKSIKTGNGERMPVLAADGVSSAVTEIQWTSPQFAVKMETMQTELNDAKSGDKSKELSTFIKGFSNKKYKP